MVKRLNETGFLNPQGVEPEAQVSSLAADTYEAAVGKPTQGGVMETASQQIARLTRERDERDERIKELEAQLRVAILALTEIDEDHHGCTQAQKALNIIGAAWRAA